MPFSGWTGFPITYYGYLRIIQLKLTLGRSQRDGWKHPPDGLSGDFWGDDSASNGLLGKRTCLKLSEFKMSSSVTGSQPCPNSPSKLCCTTAWHVFVVCARMCCTRLPLAGPSAENLPLGMASYVAWAHHSACASAIQSVCASSKVELFDFVCIYFAGLNNTLVKLSMHKVVTRILNPQIDAHLLVTLWTLWQMILRSMCSNPERWQPDLPLF